jgi:chemotaxis protein histidine kinase CheA/ActR/RegA family two-component response regulator
MNLVSSAPTATPSLADRLEALVGFWQGARHDAETRATSPSSPTTFRYGLNDIASEADAADLAGLAQALRRVALLTEVWECLRAEPDQTEAASQLADFCERALEGLAFGRRSGEREVCEAILRESDERWGDYLRVVDPINDGQSASLQPESFGDGCSLPEGDSAAPDQATLRRLLQAFGDEGSPRAPTAPQSSRAASVSMPRRPALAIPPLPARIELDEEIREAFLADAGDLFERIEKIVVGQSGRDLEREAIDELRRCFHTLKGTAGSVGLNDLATLVHELEDQLGELDLVAPPELSNELYAVVDYLDKLIDLLRRGQAAPRPTAPLPVSPPRPIAPPATLCTEFAAAAEPARTQPNSSAQAPPSEGPIRVAAARFDQLTDLASELIVQGRFWFSQAESMKTFAASVQVCRNRLLASLDRLYDVAAGPKYRGQPAVMDPRADVPDQLRRLAEQADDLAVLSASAHAAAAPMADRADTSVRLAREVWNSCQSLRIVPIRGLFTRLARVAHDAARVEERPVEVVMKGEETGMDRAVQERAFEPLLHAVRNAVAHGIEPQADRVRAGKPSNGQVTLEAGREGNTLVIVVQDDGKGLDDEAIAAKARRLGWLGPDENPSRERLHAFLFQPGFSTKSQANELSGRGVGMDVVAREVGNLRGTLELTSVRGQGTRLTVRLPARLALESALIVRVDGQPLAVPAAQVEHVEPYRPSTPTAKSPVELLTIDPATAAGGRASVTYRDLTVPVVFAREMLGIDHACSSAWRKLVLVRAGSCLFGLVVDAIDGAEDLIIKPLGALLAGHPLVAGTSLSINGEIILVLHPSGLERWSNPGTDFQASPAARPALGGYELTSGERKAVLVVDDSISVRRGIARQLCGLGLVVHEVSDGLEALGRLHEFPYGLVLTDLEMPRLDGFSLLAEIKRSASLATVPVIAASSRCDLETRRRVLKLGAHALLSKPVDPAELARTVESILPGIRA